MEERTYQILPPPRLHPHPEPRAVIQPPLRDLPPPSSVEPIDEWEPFESGPAESTLTRELTGRAREAALADERTRRLLDDKRYIAIGASLREQRDRGKSRATSTSLLYVFYNYSDNVVVEVALDARARRVTAVEQQRYQPPPIAEEIEQAIALARRDTRLAETITDDFEAGAIVISPVDPEDRLAGHRLFDVRFFYAAERLPRYMAIVDLSTETVIRAGRVDAGQADTGAMP